MKLSNETEPVRLNGWAALIVGLVLLAVIGFTLGAPPSAIIGQLAVVALSSIGGLEFARNHAWSERSHRISVTRVLADQAGTPTKQRDRDVGR